MQCSFCQYAKTLDRTNKQADDMSEEDFLRILNLKAFKHLLYIFLGKGEPLLHAQIFKMIKHIQARNMLAVMATNGLALEKRMDEFLAVPPDILWVSLYDKVLKRQIENIRKLKHHRLDHMVIGGGRIITKHNLGDIDEFIRIADDLKLSNFWLQQMIHQDKTMTDDLIFDTDTEIVQFLQAKRIELTKKYPNIAITYPTPIQTKPKNIVCYSLFKGFSVNQNGSIQPCCAIDPLPEKNVYGNMFLDEMAHLHNKKYLALKQAFFSAGSTIPPTCQHCYLCSGTTGISLLLHWRRNK
ncbi:MAG: radical SAM protein [Magnetococcus sp. YQC-5]